MSKLLSVEAALKCILDATHPTETVSVPLSAGSGQVLAKDLLANRTQPPFPASAMDGYALRGEDVQNCPVKLQIVGESAAGHGFHDAIDAGECVRIFTGAPVPPGADTIAIQENTNRSGGDDGDDGGDGSGDGYFVDLLITEHPPRERRAQHSLV